MRRELLTILALLALVWALLAAGAARGGSAVGGLTPIATERAYSIWLVEGAATLTAEACDGQGGPRDDARLVVRRGAGSTWCEADGAGGERLVISASGPYRLVAWDGTIIEDRATYLPLVAVR